MDCRVNQLKKLFMFATSMTHFQFKGKFYDQVDGVAMGSPLGPTLANLFMGHHEQMWLNEIENVEVLMYRRYVDDIFCVFHNEKDANAFHKFINCKHPNIKFTCEIANEGLLPFLDTLVDNAEFKTSTRVYRKPTFTGLYTNFFSFTCFSYKVGLIRCLLHRAFNICSSWQLFHQEVEIIHKLLQKNSFPQTLISAVTSSFIREQNSPRTINSQDISERECKFFKLPFIGGVSNLTQSRLSRITKKFCKKLTSI